MGFDLIRAMQVTQVCRDAGHMYSYGVDFSQSAYQNLLISLAPGLNMTATGGSGVVILSTVTYIDSNDCIAGGYLATTSSCANLNQTVFTRRVVVGNAGLHTSAFGTPSSGDMDSSGNISSAGYLNNSNDRAVGFSGLIPLSSGQFSYMSEMYEQSPNLSWWSYLGTAWADARSIF